MLRREPLAGGGGGEATGSSRRTGDCLHWRSSGGCGSSLAAAIDPGPSGPGSGLRGPARGEEGPGDRAWKEAGGGTSFKEEGMVSKTRGLGLPFIEWRVRF